MKRTDALIALGIFLVVAIPNLLTLPSYGLTWDFHHHFFAGLNMLGVNWGTIDLRPLPFGNPDPRKTLNLPYGPFVSIIPVLSFLLFYQKPGFAFDVSYHIPIVLFGSMGPAILYLFFVYARKNRVEGIIAAIFLALTPRYIGDLHNDMKDIPMTVMFAANMLLLYLFAKKQTVWTLLLAAAGFAIAFNTKVNAIFIPIIAGILFLVLYITKKIPRRNLLLFLSYFPIAVSFALILWGLFWKNPMGELLMMLETFGVGTNNIEVVVNGMWYCSGSTVPWWYPYYYLGIVLPIPIIIFFIVGIITGFAAILKKRDTFRIILMLWLVLPLTRYLLPTTGVIDGIRHFQEVVLPIICFAALGLNALFISVKTYLPFAPAIKKWVLSGFSSLIIIWLVVPIISYHPYQITYFNELVGGIRGANTRFDLDYWGTSQKQAIEWVNNNAPQNAAVTVIMAADVAGRYLRPDLLNNYNKIPKEQADYVVILNRLSFFYRYYLIDYLLTHSPIHTVENQGVPLVWIYDNKTPPTPKQNKWWKGEDPCIVKYW